MTWDNTFKSQEAKEAARESWERLLRAEAMIDSMTFQGRIEGACIAMSRFMTFVWMEADVVETCNGDWRATEGRARRGALVCALMTGMLRLEWPR